ncbi:hypothetical protein P3T39_006409 [Kitasatospora sp. GP82]|nr:hypothetical protein [Kitasatospora sp. GP82]
MHPRANGTTMRVADSLAGGMGRRGHVAYCKVARASLLGISERTLARHVRYLRELGVLVWIERGSKRNTRTPDEGGYAGTATIYAAAAPRCWDEAMGRRIDGEGYEARFVGVDEAGRQLAVKEARRKARGRRRVTPSFRVVKKLTTADDDGGLTTPARARAGRGTSRPRDTRPANRSSGQRRSSSVTPAQARFGMTVAQQVQATVRWTRFSDVRRIAFAIRPWLQAGWGPDEIVTELWSWHLSHLPPADPAAYIIGRLKATNPTAPRVVSDADELPPRRLPVPTPWLEGGRSDLGLSSVEEDLHQWRVRELVSVMGRQIRTSSLHHSSCSVSHPQVPWLRESEHDFATYLQRLQHQEVADPLAVYRARAAGHAVVPGCPTSEEAAAATLEAARAADHAAASIAFRVLREELDQYARAHITAGWWAVG